MPLDMGPVHVVETRGLTKEYTRAGLLSKRAIWRAVEDVDFHVTESSMTALVGASGSGKSTLSRCLVGLEKPTRGQILYQGTDISSMDQAKLRHYRRKVQIVVQGSAGTINPRFTAALAVAEPLRIAGIGNRAERQRQALYWMEQMGLPAQAADRPALEFSGGERQRLAIARVLILNPEVVIFDEAFSALDLAIETRILDLLIELRASHNLTYLFISHDLSLLSRICSEAAVMYQGRIVERASMESLLSTPAHPYSQELVRAIPRLPAWWLA